MQVKYTLLDEPLEDEEQDQIEKVASVVYFKGKNIN
jgi:hypothetical protein